MTGRTTPDGEGGIKLFGGVKLSALLDERHPSGSRVAAACCHISCAPSHDGTTVAHSFQYSNDQKLFRHSCVDYALHWLQLASITRQKTMNSTGHLKLH